MLVAVLAAIGYVVTPDGASGVVFAGAVVVTWLTGAPGGVGPAVVVTALALLVGHVAAALAGSIPVTAHADAGLIVLWARPTAAIAAGVLAAAVLVAALDSWSLPGSALVTLAAIGAVTAGAWRWSARSAPQRRQRRTDRPAVASPPCSPSSTSRPAISSSGCSTSSP